MRRRGRLAQPAAGPRGGDDRINAGRCRSGEKVREDQRILGAIENRTLQSLCEQSIEPWRRKRTCPPVLHPNPRDAKMNCNLPQKIPTPPRISIQTIQSSEISHTIRP
ncbi:hypothetical protein [Azospirillum argentinense]